MNEHRKDNAKLVMGMIAKLLKEFDFGLEIFKDGSIVFVDVNTGDGYKITAEDFQDLYDKTEVKNEI
jgi:hypothetical protein|nr:MAG TPA: hypothetical protein [Caudoviricetes sp.]